LAERETELFTFLKEHRLEAYAEVLADNRVDLESLPLLHSEDLKELGLPLGDRRKLLSAVSQLAAAGRDHSGTRSPERRHITILFCDLVDSTSLSRRLDPEELGEVLHGFTQRMTAAIERYGGHVAKLMGDGMLAYFGYPVAHEDDAERAVLAALECVRSNTNEVILTEDGSLVDLHVRIGIHAGLVVVGTIDVATGAEDDVMGEAPNVAQRLQSEAAPDEIVVSEQIRKLAGNRFEYVALEPRILKGWQDPVKLYSVRREITARTRFEVRNSGQLTPMVGRAAEVRQLLGEWKEAKAGAGRAVLIAGRAGIGKSRLTAVFFDAIRADSKTVLTFQCSPHHVGTPFFPVISRINQELEELIQAGQPSRARALRAWMRPPSSARNFALLAALLSIEAEDGGAPLDMSPRQQLEETQLLLVRQGLALARQRPLLIVFEDVHWSDPTTMRLLDLFREAAANASVMVLATWRAEFDQPAPPDNFPLRIDLDALPDTDVAELIARAAHPHPLPPEVVRKIADRAEGVPLFAEELTKSVVERIHRGQNLDGDLLVPNSLVDSLSARLDGLASAKQLAQVAAAIGREVPQALLKSVLDFGEADYARAVDELAQARLILTIPETAKGPLVFCHALIQDVAYQSMLHKDRRAIHARIAEVYERDHAGETVPELLAHHCAEARLTGKAVEYLIEAGGRAVQRSANVEAVGHLQNARELLRGKSDIPRQRALELELKVEQAIGTPLIAVEGYTSRETIRAFERAEEIAEGLGDDQARFQALFGLWGHRWMAGHNAQSLRLADEMLAIARASSGTERLILAHRCAGSSYWITGEFDKSTDHFGQVVGLTEGMDTKSLADRYVACPHVVSKVLGGYGMWLHGRRDEGLQWVEAGMRRAYELNHAYSKALSHSMMGGVMLLSENFDALAHHTTELRAVAEDRRFPYWLAYADTLEGAWLTQAGKFEEAQVKIEGSIAVYDQMGVFIHRTMQLVLLSDVAFGRGSYRKALRWLDEAELLGERTGERQWFGVIDQRRIRAQEHQKGVLS